MGYRLSKIYTRTGDDGKTQIGAKERIPKNHICIETLGTLDELNCAIGLLLTHVTIADQEIKFCLTHIQHELFDIGGELCPPHHKVISAEKVLQLEHHIDHWNAKLQPLKEFLLPGGNPASAACHFARAVCRRAERCLVALNQENAVNPESLRYVNRLSDLLFVIARILGRGQEEILWEH